jgi:hypothetical protein
MAQDMPQPQTEVTNLGTPLKALRAHCVECCNGNFAEVRTCSATACPLWLFRLGRNPTVAERAGIAGRPVYPIERTLAGTSGLKAIRRRCLDCSGGSDAGVRSCAFSSCSLHAFRFGTNPNIVRSPERKEADARRLARVKVSGLSKLPAGRPDLSDAQGLDGVSPPGIGLGRGVASSSGGHGHPQQRVSSAAANRTD